MALHAATDPQVTALRALLLGGINAELGAVLGEDAVVATYGWPAFGQQAPMRIPEGRLPAIAIWRETDRFYERTRHHVETEAILRVDYVASATPLGLLEERWPLLRLVWSTTLDLLAAGYHASVSGGARLLEDAGFTDRLSLDQRFPRVTYVVPTDGQDVHPAFRAQIRTSHRDDVDISALPDVTLHTEVYPVDLPTDEREDFEDGGPSFASEVHE